MKQDELKYPSREEIEQWMREVEAGDAEAQYQLGICYANGYGVTMDQKKAVDCFFDAVAQNHPQALYQLGNCYYYGNGANANREQAKYWYTKAAEQGHVDAMYDLSLCSLAEEESFAWCEKAAELGHAEAQFQMGIYYDDDDTWVTRPSYNKARYWYTKAAEQGHFDAQSCLEELDDAREQAEQLLYGLAECYEFGVGTECNYRLAKEYYTRAYEAKEPGDAAECYFRQRDYKKLIEYLDKLIQVEEWEEMAEGG